MWQYRFRQAADRQPVDFYTIFRPKPKETISLISADFLIKGNDAKKISDKELSELAKKKADDSKFNLRIDSKTDINSQT